MVAHSDSSTTQGDAAATPYLERRAWIGEYFDRTASAAWKALTSDAPVSRVRATVRAGRDTMRQTLLASLPSDLTGARILDAGCGTGVLAMDLARRGAHVLAIDLSPTLVEHAQERAQAEGLSHIDFRSGDMLDAGLGSFDYAIAMDSLIHYELPEILGALARLAPRVGVQMSITVAPRTPVLAAMHSVGKLFPRQDRAPSIVPVAESKLRHGLANTPALSAWSVRNTTRVERGFYRSQALVLQRQSDRDSGGATRDRHDHGGR